jgi:hypothetical protein
MRDNNRRLAHARATGAPTAALEQERSRLEQTIRGQRLYLAGEWARPERFDLDRLVEELGDVSFVEIVEVEQALYALVVKSGRVRRFLVGPSSVAVRAMDFARFALRQVARGRPTELGVLGRQLEAAVLGGAAKVLGDGPVVIAPPSRLHSTPWALLPALELRPVGAVPSAALWLRAKAARRPPTSRMVLIAGPGLPAGAAEVATFARQHPDALVLSSGSATVERSLRALDGATFAHIAAHGLYRRDSPMFSCVVLDDGPLTVHDFERLNKAPYRMVLSACESGVMAPVGANEQLGLASALFSLGTAGIVSSVTEVNDQATGQLMDALHAELPSAESIADVLLRARIAVRGEPIQEATAAAFVALGV